MPDHNAWLIKANHNLKAARKLTKSCDEAKELLLDIAIYHAQQCAEKALKGFLVFKKQCIEKTHDLEFLVKECEDLGIQQEFGNHG